MLEVKSKASHETCKSISKEPTARLVKTFFDVSTQAVTCIVHQQEKYKLQPGFKADTGIITTSLALDIFQLILNRLVQQLEKNNYITHTTAKNCKNIELGLDAVMSIISSVSAGLLFATRESNATNIIFAVILLVLSIQNILFFALKFSWMSADRNNGYTPIPDASAVETPRTILITTPCH